jgi:hypothetical protein
MHDGPGGVTDWFRIVLICVFLRDSWMCFGAAAGQVGRREGGLGDVAKGRTETLSQSRM